jgi:5-methylcytosine-specific restriction endonuclease McrA
VSERYRDRDWLEVMYHGRELTQREIAERCDVSPRTIRTYMKEFGIPTREVRGRNHGLYGRERDEETRRKISDSLEDRDITPEWRKRISEALTGRKIPTDVRERIADSLAGMERSRETRRRMSESTAGERNPNWRGGGSRREWYGPGWTVARERVRERDGVCQHCGEDGQERDLHVHHLVPVRRFQETPEANVDDAHCLSNLVLLCNECHGLAEHGRIDVSSGLDSSATE